MRGWHDDGHLEGNGGVVTGEGRVEEERCGCKPPRSLNLDRQAHMCSGRHPFRPQTLHHLQTSADRWTSLQILTRHLEALPRLVGTQLAERTSIGTIRIAYHRTLLAISSQVARPGGRRYGRPYIYTAVTPDCS
jgi:hypothetical protein